MIAARTGTTPKGPNATPPPTPVRARMLAVVVATSAIAAGCGGSGAPATAGFDSKPISGSSRFQRLVKYSECMRTHGVAGFPDPQSSANGGGALLIQGGPGAKVNPSSPAFQTAQQQCGKLLPNGGKPLGGAIPAQAKQQALRFSACMRRHGVPGFPDPQFSGNGVQLHLTPSSGVNRASPAFAAAQKACGAPFPVGIVKNGAVGGPS